MIMIDIKAKPYSFRKLGAVDVAPMCKIISKIGISNFSKCFQSDSVKTLINSEKERNDKGQEDNKIAKTVGVQVMLEIADVIIAHIPDCEKEIFNLLASVSSLEVETIKEFDLATFTEMIIDFVKKEEFGDFIKVVSKLFK